MRKGPASDQAWDRGPLIRTRREGRREVRRCGSHRHSAACDGERAQSKNERRRAEASELVRVRDGPAREGCGADRRDRRLVAALRKPERTPRDAAPIAQPGEERSLEASLRPQRLSDDEYINQDKVKGQLRIVIEAAKARHEPLEHVALYGPPGVGKTSLANVIAHELGVPIRVTSGPAMERAGDLAAILTNLEPGSILFVDEVHRLPRIVEAVLYPAMEDFHLDIVLGKG